MSASVETKHDLKLQLEWIREAGSQAGVPAPVVAHRGSRERIAWVLATLLSVAVVLAVAGFIARKPQPGQQIISQIDPPPNAVFGPSLGISGALALSPDGRRLALSAPAAAISCSKWHNRRSLQSWP